MSSLLTYLPPLESLLRADDIQEYTLPKLTHFGSKYDLQDSHHLRLRPPRGCRGRPGRRSCQTFGQTSCQARSRPQGFLQGFQGLRGRSFYRSLPLHSALWYAIPGHICNSPVSCICFHLFYGIHVKKIMMISLS